MATAEAPAAEEAVEGEPKKKKPILLIALIAISTILLLVVVVFSTLYFSGFFEHKSEAAAHEKVDELDKEAEAAKATPGGPDKVTKDSVNTRFENTYLQIDKEFMTKPQKPKRHAQTSVASCPPKSKS